MDKCVYRAAAESAGTRLRQLSGASGTRIDRMAQEPAQPIEAPNSAQPIEGPKSPLDSIFPRLVNDADASEQKLIGLIAYGLFQEAKREWVADFQIRENRYPSDEELGDYERSWTASRLQALQNAAAQVVTSYADTIMTQAERHILRNALKGSISRSAWRWLIGSVLYTGLVIGVIIILSKSGIDLMQLLTK
jgi:hypothetical protein